MNEYMKLLGLKAEDVVSGFKGVITSISFDLYGCVQAVISPGLDKDGKLQDGHWFDTKRLIITDATRVMEVPTFETVPGGYELPSQDRY